MGRMFDEKGNLKYNEFPAIYGDTVCRGKNHVENCVPKGRADKDVRWMTNPDTGHREKMYFNHALGEWCAGTRGTEKKCKEQNLNIIG